MYQSFQDLYCCLTQKPSWYWSNKDILFPCSVFKFSSPYFTVSFTWSILLWCKVNIHFVFSHINHIRLYQLASTLFLCLLLNYSTMFLPSQQVVTVSITFNSFLEFALLNCKVLKKFCSDNDTNIMEFISLFVQELYFCK